MSSISPWDVSVHSMEAFMTNTCLFFLRVLKIDVNKVAVTVCLYMVRICVLCLGVLCLCEMCSCKFCLCESC